MEAKLKAKELVDKLVVYTRQSLTGNPLFYEIQIAKKCAKIAVDEILKNCDMIESVLAEHIDERLDDEKEYWNNVKQEIEKQ